MKANVVWQEAFSGRLGAAGLPLASMTGTVHRMPHAPKDITSTPWRLPRIQATASFRIRWAIPMQIDQEIMNVSPLALCNATSMHSRPGVRVDHAKRIENTLRRCWLPSTLCMESCWCAVLRLHVFGVGLQLLMPQTGASGRGRKGRYAAAGFYPLTKTAQSEILRFVRLDIHRLMSAFCAALSNRRLRKRLLMTNRHLAQ